MPRRPESAEFSPGCAGMLEGPLGLFKYTKNTSWNTPCFYLGRGRGGGTGEKPDGRGRLFLGAERSDCDSRSFWGILKPSEHRVLMLNIEGNSRRNLISVTDTREDKA